MKEYFEFLSADKKTTVHGVIWKPEGEIKAILQISHGMKEYVERYDAWAEYLNENGILVCGNDHIGHGKSVVTKDDWGYFAKKNAGMIISKDLHYVTCKVKEMYPGVPYFILGHSMGSFMARRYLINYSPDVTGAIVMGTGNTPAAALVMGRFLTTVLGKIFGEHHKSKMVENIAFGSYNKRIDAPMSENDWLSRDEKEVIKYDATPECTFRFTVNGYRGMFETIQYVTDKKKINKVRKDLPILVISGDEDPVGAYGKEVKKCYEAYKSAGISDVTLRLVEGARHEILNEIDRDETYRYILDWINSKLS